jgi:hypothetical protein
VPVAAAAAAAAAASLVGLLSLEALPVDIHGLAGVA